MNRSGARIAAPQYIACAGGGNQLALGRFQPEAFGGDGHATPERNPVIILEYARMNITRL